METDSGKQTRLFYFQDSDIPGGDLQGVSRAHWDTKGRRGPVRGGAMRVTTTKLKPGYLRKNGVPYSDNTGLVEYYDMVKEANGDQLMVVTSVITDPMYLREPFIISSHFKKQGSDAGWKPTACSSTW